MSKMCKLIKQADFTSFLPFFEKCNCIDKNVLAVINTNAYLTTLLKVFHNLDFWRLLILVASDNPKTYSTFINGK